MCSARDASDARPGYRVGGSFEDLGLAKKRLREMRLGLSIVKNSCVLFESGQRGVYGFLDAVEKEGSMLEGASVADRVVGKAVALLCAYAKVRAVHGMTMSEAGRTVLRRYSVYHEWQDLVENILTVDRAAVCPFERLVGGVSDPQVAYERLKTQCHHSKR